MHKKELLRRSGLACLTIAFLACVLSLLFLNTHLLQRRAFAYATSEENKGGVVWKLSGESGNEWTIRDDGGAVLAREKFAQEDAIDNTYAVRPTMAAEAFGVRYSTTIDLAESHTGGCNKLGFMYYLDAENWVFVKLSSWGGPDSFGNVTGKIDGYAICNDTRGHWYEAGTVPIDLFAAGSFKLSVTVFADRCELYVNDGAAPVTSYAYTVDKDEQAAPAGFSERNVGDVYVGFAGNLKRASFGPLTLGEPAEETIGGDWSGDAAHWSYDAEKSELNGVQNQAENIDFTAYHQNGIDSAYEIAAKISMKRSGVPAGTSGRFYKAGLIPYYLDENNQVSVWLQQWGNDGFSRITANGRLNGQNLSGANGAGYWEPQELIFDTVLPVSKAETFTLKFVVTEKKIEIYLDGERLGELTPAEGNILLPAASYGTVFQNGDVSYSDISVKGYEVPVEPEAGIGGGWTSDRESNWSYDGAGKILTGVENDEDTSNDAAALHESGKIDAYEVSATIGMTQSGIAAGTQGQLYKAGLIAYHRNDDNHVAIWIQQFGNDPRSRLVAHGKLNGKNIRGANGFGYWEKENWFDDILPVERAEEFTLKCVVRAEMIDIYVNGVYIDSLTSESGSIELGGGISYGAIVQNGRAEFSGFAVKEYVPEAEKTLTVVLADSETGARIEGAVVKMGNTTLADKGNGVYTLALSGLGQDGVTVEKEGYQTYTGDISDEIWARPSVELTIRLLSVNAPYTERQREANGVMWKVNGKNNGWEFVIANDGSVVMNAEPVQDEDGGRDRKIDQTYALRPTDAASAFEVRYTSVLDIKTGYAAAGCAKLGIFPYYVDQNNYVFVKLSSWGGDTSNVNITGRIRGIDLCNENGSPWYEGGATLNTLRGVNRIAISVSVFADQVYVYIGDSKVPALTYRYLVNDGGVKEAGFDAVETSGVYVGFGGNLPEVAFSALTNGPATIVSDDLGGGWTSEFPFGWNFEEKEKTLFGESGSESMAFCSFEPNGAYVVSADVLMSKSAVPVGTEGVLYKAGIVPFYKDSDNWIAIWVQQWGNDPNARLTATGKINGQWWRNMNDAGFWDGDWLPGFNPVLQPVEFSMKFEVSGRTINIYIDDEYISSVSAPADIPCGAGQNLSYGAILQNGSAEFSNFVLQDESAIVSETKVIVTVKTIDGKAVTDAVVKNENEEFVNNGDGTYTLIVPVRSKVTVGVQKEGYVYMSYEVSSSAMYQPEVRITLQIAQEETIHIPTFEDTEPSGVNVGALVGGIVGGVAGLGLIVGATILIVKKKRK